MRTPSRRAAWLTPLLIFGLALAPRLWALGWGLPYVEHPDEPAVVEVVVRMVRDGSLNPHAFLYPSLPYYLLAAAARLHLAWGEAAGLYQSAQSLATKTYLFTSQPQLYIWLRAVTALLSALTPPLLYLLGSRMFDRRVGLLAAAGLAAARFHIEHSHFVTTDAPTGLWSTLALLGAWEVARRGTWRGYLLGALGVGLAAGTKYNAGIIGLALAAATLIYLRDVGRKAAPAQLGRLAVAGLLCGLIFLATTPYALLDYQNFVAGMLFHTSEYAKGQYGNFQGRWNIGGYLAFLWSDGLLPPAALAIMLGAPLLLRRRPRQLALLVVASAPTLLMLISLASHFVRNLLPIFPALLLLAAAGAVELADWLGRALSQRRARPVILPLLALLILAPQLRDSAWLLSYWGRPYTLEQAAEALRAQPRGMLAAVELNPVQWADDPAVAPLRRLAASPADWYRARGYRFLVLNADRYSGDGRAAYQAALGYGPHLLTMPDRDLGLQPGPGGALLDLGEHPEQMLFVRRPAAFGDKVALLGYELAPGELRARITPLEGADARELPPGQPVQINLYWRALAALDVDYTLFVHVIDAAGTTVAQRDLPLRYADYPTSRWRPGELVIDRADLPLPALPAGAYRLVLGLYDAATGAPLPAAGGGPVVLTTVTIGAG